MDKPGQTKDEKIHENELQVILKKRNLECHRKQIKKQALEHNVDVLDYAAALLCLLQQKKEEGKNKPAQKEKISNQLPSDMKMVRYRLEVGSKHQVTVEEIKKVLIEEAGVDHNRVGLINMHTNHSIVSLPSGMPSDIFFHLKKVSINQQELKITRVGGKNRHFRRKSRQSNGRRKFDAANKDLMEIKK